MNALVVAPDETVAIHDALNVPIHPDRIVMVGIHPDFPGCLYFDPGDDNRNEFYRENRKWMSRHLVLNELFYLGPFAKRMAEEGYHLIFTAETESLLDDYHRWARPLKIEGYDLFDYQQFSLNKALERHTQGQDSSERLYFWNWSAGAGKSYCCGAGIKALFDNDEIDLVIACTLGKLKINLSRFLQRAGLEAVVTDGDPKKRAAIYESPLQVYVMNFEKLRVDFDALMKLVEGQRVLFVLDEAHKVISDDAPNQSRVALDKLTRACEATVWPMSATVVGGSPLRFRDVFSLDGYSSRNPLGTKKDFVTTYARKVVTKPARTRSGGSFMFTTYDWNLTKLQEVRHHVADRTMAVRRHSKMPVLPLLIQATPRQREVFDAVIEHARQSVAKEPELNLAAHYRLLRQVAITPAALAVSDDPICAEILALDPTLAEVPSPKIEMLNALLEEIAEAQDQAVCFVHWTTSGLHKISPELEVKHVDHWGAGQSARASQKAQDDFKADKSITAFLSSDAGSHGLNFQNAKYVINIDPTYSYDDLRQRNARIDRADSYLDGLTSYVMIVEDSVEERVWKVCNARMHLAAVTQGTTEAISPEDIELAEKPEEVSMKWLLFG